jgi:multidrug efflux pump subunit AcrB
VAGGLWGLLFFDKSMSMNAAMGFILLSGTIVNNSILLLDFIIESRKRGASRALAVMRSVKVRTRPILMTATSTIIGLTPLVMEWAVGLERMSPLGIVAATGLIFGTVLTMVFVPVVYVTLDDLVKRVKG